MTILVCFPCDGCQSWLLVLFTSSNFAAVHMIGYPSAANAKEIFVYVLTMFTINHHFKRNGSCSSVGPRVQFDIVADEKSVALVCFSKNGKEKCIRFRPRSSAIP